MKLDCLPIIMRISRTDERLQISPPIFEFLSIGVYQRMSIIFKRVILLLGMQPKKCFLNCRKCFMNNYIHFNTIQNCKKLATGWMMGECFGKLQLIMFRKKAGNKTGYHKVCIEIHHVHSCWLLVERLWLFFFSFLLYFPNISNELRYFCNEEKNLISSVY